MIYFLYSLIAMHSLFFPMIIEGEVEHNSGLGTSSAYIGPSHTEAFPYANWYVEYQYSGMWVPEGKESIRIVRLCRDGLGGYEHRWCGSEEPYSEFGSLIFNATIRERVGGEWVIGNEMDVWDQDYMSPELYAKAYYEVRQHIKAADPTAKVAPGALITLSPGALQWYQRFFDEHERLYDHKPEVDFFTVHGYLISSQNNADNLTLLDEYLTNYKGFLRANGYSPEAEIVVTEFGLLQRIGDVDEYGFLFTYSRAATFLEGSILVFKNHGIKRYAWYNVYVREGDLGSSSSALRGDYTLTAVGEAFRRLSR